MREVEINFCKAMTEKVAGKQGIDNKLRYLLEDFFYEEGWASKTNAKAMKDGHHQMFSYTKQDIGHFIEDCVRLFKHGWETEWLKVVELLGHLKAEDSGKYVILTKKEYDDLSKSDKIKTREDVFCPDCEHEPMCDKKDCEDGLRGN